jgi:hypothetical protein
MKGFMMVVLTLCFCAGCARYNRVYVVLRNDTGFSCDRVISRFGDSLHIVKELAAGERSKVLKSNRTFAKGFVKAILKSGDTLLTYPIHRHGGKFYYEGKILVRLQIEKRKDGSDTLVTKTRKRFF